MTFMGAVGATKTHKKNLASEEHILHAFLILDL